MHQVKFVRLRVLAVVVAVAGLMALPASGAVPRVTGKASAVRATKIRPTGSATTLLAFFGFGILYLPHQLPPSTGAPQAGQKAPDFTLPDQDGRQVTLSTLLESGSSAGDRVNGVLLIFYRGYW